MYKDLQVWILFDNFAVNYMTRLSGHNIINNKCQSKC